MSTDTATSLLAAAAVLWFLLFAANAIQDRKIIRRLRDHNSATWQRLGRPSPLRLWNHAVGALLKSGEYQQLGDRTLVRMVTIHRMLNWAHLVAFALFLVSAFLTAR